MNNLPETKMEEKLIRLDRMKYKNDSVSRMLVILSIVFDVLYFTTLYKTNESNIFTITLGVSVIYNLLFLLAAFLSSESVKVYNVKYAYICIALGIMQIVRIFNFPLDCYKDAIIDLNTYRLLVIFLSLSAATLLAGAATSIYNCTILKNYLKSKGE